MDRFTQQMIQVIPATFADYPTIQNMARFYVYDASRYCGFISSEWAIPADGLYESFDFKNYFEDSTRRAYLVKVEDELAGFVLLNQVGADVKTNWNMGEFFILAKFQGRGVGRQVASTIWKLHPGIWDVSVIPENTPALSFWRKTIGAYTHGNYNCETKLVTFDKDQPKRVIFSFNTNLSRPIAFYKKIQIRAANVSDIPSFVEFSYKKRRVYEKAQPRFWKYMGPKAEGIQAKWFEELLNRNDHIILTAIHREKITGFIIGNLVQAPGVYDPGGLTLMIDDFCVEDETDWSSVGRELINEIKTLAKIKNATQILIVCGAHDEFKRDFLKDMGLTVASEWYVGEAL